MPVAATQISSSGKRHGRRLRERVVEHEVADAGGDHRRRQRHGEVAQPARKRAAAEARQGDGGERHRREREHLRAVKAVDQVKQRAGAAALAAGSRGAREHESEGALGERDDHGADTGEHNGASEPVRTPAAGRPPQRDHDDGEGNRRQALDQQVLGHRHTLMSGVGREHLRVRRGHIEVRRPNREAGQPRHDKGDARRGGRGEQPAVA